MIDNIKYQKRLIKLKQSQQRQLQKRNEIVTKHCLTCSNEFDSKRFECKKYCSPKCYLQRNYKKSCCLNCKKEFVVNKFNKDFCSSLCKNKFANIEGVCIKKCNHCKNEFKRRIALYNQEFCSVECIRNPIFSKSSKSFRGKDWDEQRFKTYERDKGACQRCGKQEGIAVHHVVPWKVSKDNDLTNLVCLCRKDHMTEENYYRQFKKTSSLIVKIMENK